MLEANILSLSYKEKNYEESKTLFNYENFVFIFLGYLLGHAVIESVFYTFSIIYIISIIKLKTRRIQLTTCLATAIGLFLNGGFIALFYIFATLPMILFDEKGKNNENSKMIISFSVPIIHFLLYFIYYYFFTNKIFLDYLYRAVESTIILFVILLFIQEKEIFKKKKSQNIILIFLLSGSFIGFSAFLSTYLFYSLYIIDCLLISCIALLSWYTKLERGIFYAVLLGLSLFLTGFIPFLSLIKYLIFSLIVGIFSGEKKYFYFLSVFFSFFLYSGFSPTYEDFLITGCAVFTSIISYLFLPAVFFKKFSGENLRKKFSSITGDSYSDQENYKFNNSFRELAKVFTEISVSFSETLPETKLKKSDKFANFIYLYEKKVCKTCKYRESCMLEKEKRNKRIIEILKLINSNGFSDNKIKVKMGRCPDDRLSKIKTCYEILLLNNFWKKKIIEKQKMVSNQLQGISNIINNISHRSHLDLNNKVITDNINNNILKDEFDIYDLKAFRGIKNEHLNLSLSLEPCSGNEPCKNQLPELLKNEFDINFRPIECKCGSKLKDRKCEVHYSECGRYMLDITVKQISKENKSGDSYFYSPLADGTDLLALSDGMGVGTKAARESKSALKLLEKSIKAGFSRKLAIETINSTLFLRNKEEKFTTLDIVFFNTFTGEALFNKIGSAVSFIKRDFEIEVIKPSSLPVGILENIEISEKNIKLNTDDFVIMFSDGVIDALENVEDKEKWFKKLLQNSSFYQPEELAEYIIEVIKKKGNFKDDFTVIVFKICEIGEKSRKLIR